MRENKKHTPPLQCRIAAILIPPSPSAMLCKCLLGRHRQTRRCVGCSANSGEIIVESLQRGFEDGLKSPPPFKLSAGGKTIQILRGTTEMSPGAVYSRQPEGLQHLYTLDETPDTEAEAEAPEWPKDNPYLKQTDDDTFTAEARISPDCGAKMKGDEAVNETRETNEKIIKALEHCVGGQGCETCPARADGKPCEMSLRAILDVIHELTNKEGPRT